MKVRLIILSGAVCVFTLACRSDKAKLEAEAKTRAFFLSLKKSNEKEMTRLYPGFSNFDHYYKSDSGTIVSTADGKERVAVAVDNRFTNGFGKLNQQSICLYYKIDSLGQVNLYDSKGLSDFDDNDDFIFGSKTGCIDSRADTTDQQIIKQIKRTKRVMLDKAVAMYLELKRNIQVVHWNWESGYSGSASGQGIVRNGSSFTIPKLKYKITYKNELDNPITSDDGYVVYGPLEAGESKSFTFYTSYVGGASRASIELLFDEEMIFKYLSKKDWSGNECALYFKDHPDSLVDR